MGIERKSILLLAAIMMAAGTLSAAGIEKHAKKESLRGSHSVKVEKAQAKRPPLNPSFNQKQNRLYSAKDNFFNPDLIGGSLATRVKSGVESSATSKKLYGNVVYEYSWTQTGVGNYRMVSIDLDSHVAEDVFAGPNGQYGAVFYQGNYFTCTAQVIYNLVLGETNTIYNTADWSVTSQYDYAPKDFRAIDMTYDPQSGLIYGCFVGTEEEGYVFGRFDPFDCHVTPISVIGQTPWFGLAANKEGGLFAIDNAGILYKVNKDTGESTLIKDTKLASAYACSATIDPDTGLMYYTPMSGTASSAVYQIDTADGSISKVCDLPGGMELVGIYFNTPEAAPGAPGKVSDLTIDFEESALNGKVKFTAPTALFNGNAASGEVKYCVLIDGKEVKTGTTTYGAAAEAEVTIPKGGRYTIAVYLSNAEGDGPKSQIVQYLGPDIPEGPSDVKLVYNEETHLMQLSWTAPTVGENGTAISPENVNYNITAYPSGKVVSMGQNATTYEEAISPAEEFTSYYYIIEAENHGQISQSVSSNVIPIGVIFPPYFESFDTEQGFDAYKVIDVTGDNKTWVWKDGSARAWYNSSAPKDDWLITPGVKLKKGLTYRFSFHTGIENIGYTEYLSLYVGDAPTVEGMTTALIPQTLLTSRWERGGEIKEAYYTPDSDGVYYFGFYVNSPTNAYWIYVNDICIDAGISPASPDCVLDLKATPDPQGKMVATVNFTVPDKTVSGDPLGNITQIQILREGKLIKTVNPVPAKGQTVSYRDENVTAGVNQYSVVAYTAEGAGKIAKTSVYVGYAEPAEVTEMRILPGEDDGQVIMEWDPVLTDVHGLVYPKNAVTYILRMITSTNRIDFAEGVTDTRAKVKITSEDGEQVMPLLGAIPVSEWGEGYGTGAFAPAGKPYSLPFVESCPDGNPSTPVGVKDVVGSGNWMSTEDDDAESQDGDNGMFVFIGEEPPFDDDEAMENFVYDCTDLFTARIYVPENAVHPVYRFYYLSLEDIEDTIEGIVSDDMGRTWKSLSKNSTWEPDHDFEWIPVTIPLDEYKGKSIQIGLRATVVNFGYIFVDNLSVFDQADYDISKVAVHLPSALQMGEAGELTVTYANTGLNATSGVTVDIFRNGEGVATLDTDDLEPGEEGMVTYKFPTTVLEPKKMTFYARVNYTQDQHPDDNTSAEETFNLSEPPYPIPTDAKSTRTGEGVEITWTQPDLTLLPTVPSTDDFESYESFQAEDLGGWISVKVDNGVNGGFQNLDIPNVTPGETKIPFFVFDVEDDQFNTSFNAHSGTKYMATLFNYDDSKIDSWLISPELSGSSQIVTFWARSYSAQYPESFDIRYSDGSTDPADFKAIEGQSYKKVPGEWTPYSVALPAGARRIAIHAISESAFMFLVDDVKLQLSDSPQIDLTLKGYNVYENGKKLNSNLVESPLFNIPEVDQNVHTYLITALYDLGESAPSEPATLEAGVAAVSTDGVSVVAAKGHIVVHGAEGKKISVNTLDGKNVINAEVVSSSQEIPLEPGVYLVKVGNLMAKLLVR